MMKGRGFVEGFFEMIVESESGLSVVVSEEDDIRGHVVSRAGRRPPTLSIQLFPMHVFGTHLFHNFNLSFFFLCSLRIKFLLMGRHIDEV